MPHDDLLVRNAIQHMGVNASLEWIRQCIAFKQNQDPSFSSSSSSLQELTHFIFEMYLLADFRILGSKPLLPSSITTYHKQRLFIDVSATKSNSNSTGHDDRLGQTSGGGVILQILEVQDIGVSLLKMVEACEALGVKGDEPGGFQVEKTLPKSMITLDVTDGVRKIKAMVTEPIPEVAIEMKLGAKIRVKDVEVRHGMLQLSPSNTLLLGGEVASMNRHPRRLAIMNQMKKRLGLPLDILPTTSASPAELHITERGITSTTATTSNNNNLGINFITSTNIWGNPQQVVNIQDSPPFATASNQSSCVSSVARGIPAPLSPLPSERQRFEREDDVYFRLQREQEPQWDFQCDMEMDDIMLPEDDVGWEDMSELSSDQGKEPKRNPTNSDQHISSRTSNSPPVVAVAKDVPGCSLIHRKISLKSSHSQQRQKKQQDNQGEEEHRTNNSLAEKQQVSHRKPKRERSFDDGDTSRDNNNTTSSHKSSALDFFNLGNRSSPRHDGVGLNGPLHKSVHSASLSRMNSGGSGDLDLPTNDSGYNDYVESTIDVNRSEAPWSGRGVERSKRRVSPEHESVDQDFSTSRRRSRSFPTAPLLKETSIKIKVEKDRESMIKVEKDSESMIKVKLEKPEDTDAAARAVGGSGIPQAKYTTPDRLPWKFKTDNMEAKKAWIPCSTVIDLLSDDDDGDEHCTTSVPDQIKSIPIPQEIAPTWTKSTALRGQGASHDHGHNTEVLTQIKQEETLLELDMDDENDFEDLSETVHVVPEIRLDQVKEAVRSGREVRAIARVHKLGKFSLTTLTVSIPIVLLPVAVPSSTSMEQSDNDMKVEAVLDHNVATELMDYSIYEFRELVRTDEPGAKRAVGRIRTRLSEVESVECLFSGLRGHIPVVRALKVLTKKRK